MQSGPVTLPASSPSDNALHVDERLDRFPLTIRLQFSQALAKEKEGDLAGKNAILNALPPTEAAHYDKYKENMERMRVEEITTVSRANPVPASVAPPVAASNTTQTGAAPVLTSFELKRTNASAKPPVANTTDTDTKVKSSKCCALV